MDRLGGTTGTASLRSGRFFQARADRSSSKLRSSCVRPLGFSCLSQSTTTKSSKCFPPSPTGGVNEIPFNRPPSVAIAQGFRSTPQGRFVAGVLSPETGAAWRQPSRPGFASTRSARSRRGETHSGSATRSCRILAPPCSLASIAAGRGTCLMLFRSDAPAGVTVGAPVHGTGRRPRLSG